MSQTALQAGERGDREVAFYAAVEQDRQSTAAGPPGSNVMQELAKWIPKSCESWWHALLPALQPPAAPAAVLSTCRCCAQMAPATCVVLTTLCWKT